MTTQSQCWVLPEDGAASCSNALASAYQSASPFPHVVLDNFLSDEVVDQLLKGFPDPKNRQREFSNALENLKSQFHPRDAKTLTARNILNELNSDTFLDFLTKLTGISGLVSDPYFAGGGFHETRSGGKLNIHADFSHHIISLLQRRINLIVFLNRDWRSDYGGNLELWDRHMKRCEISVLPVAGRAVIFNTDSDSFHGHPDPLKTPPDLTRRSIALYYYTLPEDLKYLIQHHTRTTHFQARPGTADRAQRGVRVREWIRDLTPPLIWRSAARVGKPKQ